MIFKVSRSIIIIFIIPLFLTGCFSKAEQVEVPETTAEKALEIALNQLGKSYQLGGRRPDKFDCSGLITWSYKKAVGKSEIFEISGYLFTDATMSDLYNWNVIMIPLEDVKPGDIMFFTKNEDDITHGGLFIEWVEEDLFKFVHASSAHREVIVGTWPVGKIYGGQWLVGAGRFKKAKREF